MSFANGKTIEQSTQETIDQEFTKNFISQFGISSNSQNNNLSNNSVNNHHCGSRFCSICKVSCQPTDNTGLSTIGLHHQFDTHTACAEMVQTRTVL